MGMIRLCLGTTPGGSDGCQSRSSLNHGVIHGNGVPGLRQFLPRPIWSTPKWGLVRRGALAPALGPGNGNRTDRLKRQRG
jgi:hypothetical protein